MNSVLHRLYVGQASTFYSDFNWHMSPMCKRYPNYIFPMHFDMSAKSVRADGTSVTILSIHNHSSPAEGGHVPHLSGISYPWTVKHFLVMVGNTFIRKYV
jgi:hypothetical protein